METQDQTPDDQDQAPEEQYLESYEVGTAPTTSSVIKNLFTTGSVMVFCVFILFFIARPSDNGDFWVAIPVLVFVLMAARFVSNLIRYLQVKRLDSKGILTTVIVNRVYTSSISYQDPYEEIGRSTSTEVYILEYDLPEGWRIKNSVTKDDFMKVNKGDLIKVRYLPDSLSLQRVELNG